MQPFFGMGFIPQLDDHDSGLDNLFDEVNTTATLQIQSINDDAKPGNLPGLLLPHKPRDQILFDGIQFKTGLFVFTRV
jgi:hypothetical protein